LYFEPNAANGGRYRLLASLHGKLVLLDLSDFECWDLWSQDKEQPEMDEVEDNSAALRSYYHHPEQASPQARGLVPQEVLYQADS
jgi:hypothetical protein